MRNSGLPQIFFLLVLCMVITLSCGSLRILPNCGPPTPTRTNPSGPPQAITVCPAVADAWDYPGGQVQFIATGYYQTPPSPVTPLAALWGVCYKDAPTAEASITSGGLAECAKGSKGTFSVFAAEPTYCNAITACGGGCLVSGYAKLACP
jgi:hypothetical protein